MSLLLRELDLLGDGAAVLGGFAVPRTRLVDDDIAALRAGRDLYGVGGVSTSQLKT